MVSYVLAVLIGYTMGLFGGGGSILTVPVLVYGLSIVPTLATTYSFFIVSLIALNGVRSYWAQKLVVLRAAWLFLIPSVVAIFTMRNFILPQLPAVIWETPWGILTKEKILMFLFSLTMLWAAMAMLRNQAATSAEAPPPSIFSLGLRNFSIGLLIGAIGAGGGFLIVPALVSFARLSMKQAIGTSLFIILLNASVGFWTDPNLSQVNWWFLVFFAGLAASGVGLGTWHAQYLQPAQLKKGFGYLVLIIGGLILFKELFSLT